MPEATIEALDDKAPISFDLAYVEVVRTLTALDESAGLEADFAARCLRVRSGTFSRPLRMLRPRPAWRITAKWLGPVRPEARREVRGVALSRALALLEPVVVPNDIMSITRAITFVDGAVRGGTLTCAGQVEHAMLIGIDANLLARVIKPLRQVAAFYPAWDWTETEYFVLLRTAGVIYGVRKTDLVYPALPMLNGHALLNSIRVEASTFRSRLAVLTASLPVGEERIKIRGTPASKVSLARLVLETIGSDDKTVCEIPGSHISGLHEAFMAVVPAARLLAAVEATRSINVLLDVYRKQEGYVLVLPVDDQDTGMRSRLLVMDLSSVKAKRRRGHMNSLLMTP